MAISKAYADAQPARPADQARRLLQSQSFRDKAWGAWFAGVSHDTALREPLIEQLRLAQSLRDSERDTEGYAYIQALFDSLIQIAGPIPSDVTLPFETSWRPEILILMSFDTENIWRTAFFMRSASVSPGTFGGGNVSVFTP